jgi:hypothetical protein
MYPAGSLFTSSMPMEMTNITKALTTFAFYEIALPSSLDNTAYQQLTVGTTQANGMTAYIDGAPMGIADEHSHGNGRAVTLKISLSGTRGAIEGDDTHNTSILDPTTATKAEAGHTLTILSEELGYANYGFLHQLVKGITGDVALDGTKLIGTWKMRGGLAGEHLKLPNPSTSATAVPWTTASTGAGKPSTWYKTSFGTPAGVSDAKGGKQLLLHASGLGRGRFWVNGTSFVSSSSSRWRRSSPACVRLLPSSIAM